MDAAPPLLLQYLFGEAANTITTHFNKLVDSYRWTLRAIPTRSARRVQPRAACSPAETSLASTADLSPAAGRAARLYAPRPQRPASRIHALTMLRLSLGTTLSKLVKLRWGQIELDPPQAGESAAQVWVRLAEGGLRGLGRGLRELRDKAQNSAQASRLSQASTRLTTLLAAMVEAENRRRKGSLEDDRGMEDILARYDQACLAEGLEPQSPAIRREARSYHPEGSAASVQLDEEIAATRQILRDTLHQAQQAERQGDGNEYLRQVELYGSDCRCLMRLVKSGGNSYKQLEAYWSHLRNEAIEEAAKDWPALDLLDDYPPGRADTSADEAAGDSKVDDDPDQGDDLSPADDYTPL